MTIKLSLLVIILGLVLALPQVYALLKPTSSASALRKFPRSMPWGYALMLLGTAWFLYNLSLESIADFASYKNVLVAIFAGIGIASCIFVQDFLAVRGLAIVLLLLGKLMVDTGRPYLPTTNWVLVIQVLAYVLVVAGIWLTISPWRLRDAIDWDTRTVSRFKMTSAVRLAVGLLLAALGLFVF